MIFCWVRNRVDLEPAAVFSSAIDRARLMPTINFEAIKEMMRLVPTETIYHRAVFRNCLVVHLFLCCSFGRGGGFDEDYEVIV